MAVGPVINIRGGGDCSINAFQVGAIQSDVVLQEKDNIAVRHFCTPQSLG